MRRRGVGIGSIQRQQKRLEKYEEKGKDLADTKVEHVNTQLTLFHEQLSQFAARHRHEITHDAVFRLHFQKMCTAIGVDPLASKKGFWAEILNVGDFYYTLAVQILEVCLQTRDQNGGLMAMTDLLNALKARKVEHLQTIVPDDVRRAVSKLHVLGNGFSLMTLAGQDMIVTVPVELSADHGLVLSLAQENKGSVTIQALHERYGWDSHRSTRALHVLMREGMAWIDTQVGMNDVYAFPSLCLSISKML